MNFHTCGCRVVPAYSQAMRLKAENNALILENARLSKIVELDEIIENTLKAENKRVKEIMNNRNQSLHAAMKANNYLKADVHDLQKKYDEAVVELVELQKELNEAEKGKSDDNDNM